MDCDSVWFYNSVLMFVEDPDEEEDVNELLLFWNQYDLSLFYATCTILTLPGK
jgi:hypothetical protein